MKVMVIAKKIRPKMETKNELMSYLRRNKDTELPFVKEVWDMAIEQTAGKSVGTKVVETVDENGDIQVMKVADMSNNPVSKYFQLMSLQPNKLKGEALREKALGKAKNDTVVEVDSNTDSNVSNDNVDIIVDINDEFIGDDRKNSFITGLVNIYFSKISDDDLDFVVSRLSEYYTNYEFNEGSDKFLVVSVVSDELSLRDLYSKRIRGSDNEKRIKDVQDGYLKKLDSLKVLKKQGSTVDEGKNKFTVFVDTLEKAGELKYKAPVIDNDVIGNLVNAINNSVIRAFSDG